MLLSNKALRVTFVADSAKRRPWPSRFLFAAEVLEHDVSAHAGVRLGSLEAGELAPD